MKANETTVQNLLQGERQYIVPLYQRRYSWSRADLERLWLDLMQVIDDGNRASHFMGSVVLAPDPTNSPSGVQRWLVVDGQQRLTTLSILFCAIRDHVRDPDPKLAEKIDDLYLFNRHASGSERYTLLPTKADRTAWQSLVDGMPDSPGADHIGQAYTYFRAMLTSADDPDDDQDVVRIERAIAQQLSIVEIAAHNDDNPHRIFESLNHTGQDLTQADLLRNYLFMRLPRRGDQIYELRWLPLQSLVDDRQLEQLVWLDLVLRGDDRATQDATYDRQRERLQKLPDEDALEQWIIELHLKARLFQRIIIPAKEPNPEIAQALDRLSRWDVSIAHPIILHVLIAYDAKQLNVADTVAALRMVESYLVRRMLVGQSSTGVNRILMSLVRELGSKVPHAEVIRQALSGPRKKFPTDTEVQQAVQFNYFYWLGRGPQRTFVLRCLEEDHQHGEPVNYDAAKLSIEHVLPQNMTKDWRDALSGDARDGESVDEVHDRLVHTLGNLTLTAFNAKLSNDNFETKRVILRDSGIAMNREIARARGWGQTQILKRGRNLAERVVTIWPGPDESVGTAVTNPRWSLMTQVIASIPAGRWTSFLDIAEVLGSNQNAVSARVGAAGAANVHRILRRDGIVSGEFRWPDPDRKDDPRAVLVGEGVAFDEYGRADQSKRMSALDLADVVGLTLGEGTETF